MEKHLDKNNLELLSKFQSGELDINQFYIDSYNGTKGNLGYYDCPKCKNRGEYAIKNESGEFTLTICDCMRIRRSNRLLHESGIEKQLKIKTFDNFICQEPWQQYIFDKCMKFTQSPSQCLFVGGQSGAGKTHLCTAVCGRFAKAGKTLKYVLWRDIVTKLQANIFNDDAYTKILDDLKNVDVLYIDDLFKLIPTKTESRVKELEIAFKLLNSRELSNKITIISTECTMNEIKSLDEAIAGRIAKMSTREYIIQISRKSERNYRLKELEEV